MVEEPTQFQVLCMEIGEFLAVTGMMDAHLKHIAGIHEDDAVEQVLDGWEERIQEVRAFLNQQREEIFEFGSSWDV